MNDSDQQLRLKAGQVIGQAEEIDEVIPQVRSVSRSDASETAVHAEVSMVESNTKPDKKLITVPAHLEKLYQESITDLSLEQSARLAELLCNYADVFANHDLDLGEFSGIQHRIPTVDETPVKLRMRRTPLRFEQEEEKHLHYA